MRACLSSECVGWQGVPFHECDDQGFANYTETTMTPDRQYMEQCERGDAGAQYMDGRYYRFIDDRSLEAMMDGYLSPRDAAYLRADVERLENASCDGCDDLQGEVDDLEKEVAKLKSLLSENKIEIQ